jgi:hypothetical protein
MYHLRLQFTNQPEHPPEYGNQILLSSIPEIITGMPEFFHFLLQLRFIPMEKQNFDKDAPISKFFKIPVKTRAVVNIRNDVQPVFKNLYAISGDHFNP